MATPNPVARSAPSFETVVRPPVDIVEDAEGVTLQADVPGVSKERLNVHVEGNTLLLEGEVSSGENVTKYRRSFTLGRELQTGTIEAKVKDGVLTVRIAKRAEDRPRKIAVQ
jgi:HSP20 family protein